MSRKFNSPIDDACWFGNEFYTSLDWFGLDYSGQNKILMDSYSDQEILEWLPMQVNQAVPVYFEPVCDDDLMTDILEGFDLDYWLEQEIDEYWEWCEVEFSYEILGIPELQSAIDVFVARNNIAFSLFENLRFCWGKSALKKAFKVFTDQNRHFWWYDESDTPVDLPVEFWRKFLD